MSAADPGSVTDWLRSLEGDESDAAQQLWDRFFGRLVKVAESIIRAKGQLRVDGEEVAVDVMTSLWRGARDGRFRDVKNRDELWWLLLRMTRMTTVDGIRRVTSQKRGGATNQYSLGSGDPSSTFFQLVSREPSPEDAVTFAEDVSRLLSLLPDKGSREIAVYWLEGLTQPEIAARVNVSTATVARKLRLIRQSWAAELQQ